MNKSRLLLGSRFCYAYVCRKAARDGFLYGSICRKASSGGGDCLKTQIMQKSPPTEEEEIGVNFQCKSHFMTKNSNKNGMGIHQPLVFGQSGGGLNGINDRKQKEAGGL